jgi:30S ribosomal protein S31
MRFCFFGSVLAEGEAEVEIKFRLARFGHHAIRGGLVILNNVKEVNRMGKGDRRTRRGKIWRGSTGKSRPKNSAKANKASK